MSRPTTLDRQPSSSATRSRSAGSKAISPRMARSVIAATSAFRPTKSASSSMHSCSIMVESMSARNRRLRRVADRLHDDVDRHVGARDAAAPPRPRPARGRRTRDRPRTPRRECVARRRRAASAASAQDCRRRWTGVAGSAYQRRDDGLGWPRSGELLKSRPARGRPVDAMSSGRVEAVLIAGPTASGKSALALRPRARARRHRSSTPIPCRSTATCAS